MAVATVTFTDDDRLAEIVVAPPPARISFVYMRAPVAEAPSGGVEAAIGIASPARPAAIRSLRIDNGP